MKTYKTKTIIGVLSLLAISASTLAFAQIRISGNPSGATPSNGRPPPIVKKKQGTPLLFHAYSPAPTIAYNPAFMANMGGWTKLTQGAVNGSPAITKTADGAVFVGRGGDNSLYLAPVNIHTPIAINPSEWQIFRPVFASGVSCQPNFVWSATNRTFSNSCYGLSANGGAIEAKSNRLTGTSYSSSEETNLGGQNAGGLPMGIGFDVVQTRLESNPHPVRSIVTIMADNSLWLMTERVIDTASLHGDSEVATTKSWIKLNGLVVGSAASCVDTIANGVYCAIKSVNNFVFIVKINNGTIDGKEYPERMASNEYWKVFRTSPTATPNISQILTSAPAIILHPSGRLTIVVRDYDGSLKRIIYRPDNNSWSSWSDEGGYLAQGSQPSCVSDGEVPVCVIQGPDGAAYLKRLSAASGI